MNHKANSLLGLALLLTAAGTLASCTMGADYQRPPLEVPRAYKSAASQAASAPASMPAVTRTWWRLFGESELTALEEAALAASPTLQAAVSRVDEARAAVAATRSQLYPAASFNPSAIRSRASATVSPSTNLTTTNYLLPFDLSYEVDVWGRVRRTIESSNAQLQASIYDVAVVQQTLTSEVAIDYFTLRALDDQAAILARNVETFRRQLDLTQKQKKVGMASQVDVVQAQVQVDSTITQEIDTRRQRADMEHALAILIGRPPSEVSLAVRPLDLKPPVIPPGLPADLLRRRPDVAEAEQNLAAANALIGVAQANFYPAVNLTGAAGFETLDIRHIVDWQSRIWSVGPSVSAPIFTGGLLEANLAQAKARYEELAANYRNTILGAFRDVEDNLVDLRMRADEADAQARAVAGAREYVRLSEVQYQKGLGNYLLVVDADRTLLANELSASQIQLQRMTSAALLIKAMGGGWDVQTAMEELAASRPATSQPASQPATAKK